MERKLLELTQKYMKSGLDLVEARLRAKDRIKFEKSVDSMDKNNNGIVGVKGCVNAG